jgi:hypothetical protein
VSAIERAKHEAMMRERARIVGIGLALEPYIGFAEGGRVACEQPDLTVEAAMLKAHACIRDGRNVLAAFGLQTH